MPRLQTPRRQRNTTIYTGLVGAKMRPLAFRSPRPRAQRKHMVRCLDKPWIGHSLCLSKDSGSGTLPIIIAGSAGRYLGGKWLPHHRESAGALA